MRCRRATQAPAHLRCRRAGCPMTNRHRRAAGARGAGRRRRRRRRGCGWANARRWSRPAPSVAGGRAHREPAADEVLGLLEGTSRERSRPTTRSRPSSAAPPVPRRPLGRPALGHHRRRPVPARRRRADVRPHHRLLRGRPAGGEGERHRGDIAVLRRRAARVLRVSLARPRASRSPRARPSPSTRRSAWPCPPARATSGRA